MSLIRKVLNRLRPKKIVQVNVSTINYVDLLKDKNVLITGGSSGIGLAIAKKCLSLGAKVVVTGRSIGKLNDVSAQINNKNFFAIEWDISQVNKASEKISEVLQRIEKIDILVNNSGIYAPESFFDTNEELFDHVMDTNLKGLYFATKEIAKYFICNDIKGKIINISSITSITGASIPYGLSKWGVEGLTKGLARDLIKYGIIVNAVAPGVVATAINPDLDLNKNMNRVGALTDRASTAEEIAEIVVFLSSNSTTNIIGQTIVCDGGETLI